MVGYVDSEFAIFPGECKGEELYADPKWEPSGALLAYKLYDVLENNNTSLKL